MSIASYRTAIVANLRVESLAELHEYAGIPSVCEARTIFDVAQLTDGFDLLERQLLTPFRKNYDELESPLSWAPQLRQTPSTLISAFVGSARVGGIIAVHSVPGLFSWVTGPRAAILWDLRVSPAYRRHSIATSLVQAAQAWAKRSGCGNLLVETQNTNVAACKFYMHNGFEIWDARYGAYLELPGEARLIWRRSLDG